MLLFTEPRRWTQRAVGSWWRFGFIAAAEAALIIYALRRMHLQAMGTERS